MTKTDTQPGNTNPKLSVFANWTSLAGMILAASAFFAVVCLIALDFIRGFNNPFMGILTYMVAPVFLVAGLIMISLGERCQRLGSANDGAVWIDRITTANYPHIVYTIDWAHSHGRLSNVAKAAFGDGTPQAQQWTHKQVDLLWHGRVEEVVAALQILDWAHIASLDDIRNSPTYFESRKSNMDYARLRQEGYPIGSGTVEGDIHTVVHHRMKRQGRGWKRQHAQAMLAALGELHSGRFQLAWQATT